LCYSLEPVENWSYEDQPHEIEAREEEVRLYDWYMSDTFGMPDNKVAQRFSNRLRNAL